MKTLHDIPHLLLARRYYRKTCGSSNPILLWPAGALPFSSSTCLQRAPTVILIRHAEALHSICGWDLPEEIRNADYKSFEFEKDGLWLVEWELTQEGGGFGA